PPPAPPPPSPPPPICPAVRRTPTRREPPPLLSGRARFMGDLRLPDLLTVAFARSPHAHARLLDIDVRAALAMPGVEAIVTGAELATTTRPMRAELSGD